jgi:hypothetical protein
MLVGALLLLVGFLVYVNPSIPFLGKLPGDIRVERPGFRFYFPITTCILLSVVLSVIAHFLSRIR